FSSRRRHTRSKRDWSSDVCSSDLSRFFEWLTESQHNLKSFSILRIIYGVALLFVLVPSTPERSMLWGEASFWVDPEASRRGYWKIGRASCRERVGSEEGW